MPVQLDERTKTAFDCTRDTSKQLLTLAAAIIALTVPLLKFAGVSGGAATLMICSWVLYLVSVIGGVWVLLAIDGSLGSTSTANEVPSVYGRNIQIPTYVQVVTFITALVFTVIFGGKLLAGH